MNNFKKLITAFTLTLIAAALLFVLTSCDGECKHEWGEWTMVEEDVNPCEDGGEMFRVCEKDESHVEYKTVEPTEHNWGGEIFQLRGGHYQYCQNDGCDKRNIVDHVSGGAATEEMAEYCSVCGYEMSPKLHMLSNKKIIFIGNSHTYFGGLVNEKKQTVHNISNRQNDIGTFFKIARDNGATNLNVTNWTYGGHSLSDTFSGYCEANRECKAVGDTSAGYDHLADLTDRYYDYVVIQQGSTKATDLMYWLEYIQDIFREANPNVKFFFIVQGRAHNDNYAWLTDVKRIESELGMTIIDWGDLVYDVYSGATAVPGAKVEHVKNSYVIAKSKDDGFHPSILAGYVASLMTYCAITGDSAVGQRYDYYEASMKTFIANNYKNGEITNLDAIFKSEADMRGLQSLIDKYLEEKYYRTYTAENH